MGQSRLAAARSTSNVKLLRYCKRIVDLDAKIPDSALDLRSDQQKLNHAQVPRNKTCFFCPRTRDHPRNKVTRDRALFFCPTLWNAASWTNWTRRPAAYGLRDFCGRLAA